MTLFRRLVSLLVVLGVALSTPGIAIASCEHAAADRGGMVGDAGAADGHAGHEGAPGRVPADPSDAGDCTIVVHCSVAVAAEEVALAIGGLPPVARQATARGLGPLDLARQPDSPPPRA
jgi:hypothetical protein